MKERHPNLPSVLTNYDPDFVLTAKDSNSRHRRNNNSDNNNTNRAHAGVPESSKSPKKDKTSRVNKPEPVAKVNTRASSSEGLEQNQRSKSAKKRSKDEGERLEHVAALWDQVRQDYQQERHEVLEEKVRLQQRLIKAQDQRASHRRQHQAQAEHRKRSEERKAKKDVAAALQSRGRQSTGSEKSSRAGDDAPSVHSAHEESDGDVAGSSSSPTTTDSSGQRRARQRQHHHTGYLPSETYAPAASPMREDLVEEEEEVDEKKPRAPDGVVTPADLSSVPWHHAQLYKMYGRHADYYIHPKMQPEKKKIVNPTLKSQKGHLGASHIWTTLRRDSMNKLHKTDRRFPQELKSAFSAHVREGITNHKNPVFRNFTVTEDVPDLNRLMDQSLLRRIRVLRHKTELMYRSSQTNNDRTKVLLFNSPLPAVNEGDEGISKYLPSWNDTEGAESELSYTKWLKENAPDGEANITGDSTQRSDQGENNPVKKLHPDSVLSPLGSEFSDSLHSVWDSIMARQRPRPQPRYHFLTEEEARTPGAFLEKLGMEKDKLDLGRIDLLTIDHEGRASTERRSSMQPDYKALSAPQSRSSRHSVAGPLPPVDKSAYETRWQPLSLHALVEYKDQMATQGAGEFHQGRPTMWNAGVAASID